MADYLLRSIDLALDRLLRHAPAVAIDGPKGVGKTETCGRRGTVFSLDNRTALELVKADPTFSATPGTVVVDEWQRFPEIWDAVRHSVDAHAPAARYLLTGSVTPAPGISTHSGAGRILSLRMRPMGLHERGVTAPTISLRSLLTGEDPQITGDTDWSVEDYAREILISGFPAIRKYRANEQVLFNHLDSYIMRIFDRELPESGAQVRRPVAMRRWLTAYAAANGTTARQSQIAAAAWEDTDPPARATINTYREHLSRLWLLDPLPGWVPSQNPFTTAQQSAKHYLADPALTARLHRLSLPRLLSPTAKPRLGSLFESLAVLIVRAIAEASGATVSHLRTKRGDREIDMIVETYDGNVTAIEVKLAAEITDTDCRHLQWLKEKMGDTLMERIVICTGTRAYRRADGICVIPLACLGN